MQYIQANQFEKIQTAKTWKRQLINYLSAM